MDFLKKNFSKGLLGLAAIAGTVLLWFSFQQQRAHVGVPTQAVPARAVTGESKVDTPIQSGTVKAYSPRVKAKTNLPESVQANPDFQVIDSIQIPADDHPQTLTTAINIKTGETQSYYTRESYPLFALDYTGDAGLYYGYRNGSTAMRAEARQAIFRIKAVHFGLIGSFDQPLGGGTVPATTFIGGGGWGSWDLRN